MTCGQTLRLPGCSSNFPVCPDRFGCVDSVCLDFTIKQHDTQPPFRVSVEDCNGPLDLTDTVAEVSMWAKAKFKKAVAAGDTYFALADGVGFEQVSIGDVIVVERVRNPEQMIVTGFDETLHLVQVQRGYNGTAAGTYKKGTAIKMFRILNGAAETHSVTEDVTDLDGTVERDVVTDSQLVYEWLPQDTCLPGCYWVEFKLLKMAAVSSLAPGNLTACVSTVGGVSSIPSLVPSFVTSVSGCDLGAGVEWVRRFPVDSEAFYIRILPSPTAENVS